jgi:putative nucleotidyltransferase with HDIG domain
MEPDTLPAAPRRGPDVASWAVVGLALVATAFTALAGATRLLILPTWATSTSVAALVAAIAVAAWRHAHASHAAHECKHAYDVAFASEVAARERLVFARHTASLMSSLPLADGLRAVLEESNERFSSDAAAIVGDDITIVTAEGVQRQEAQTGVLHVALETVRAGRAVAQELTDDQASALTIPLRIRGQLHNVMVLWRRGGGFGPDDLDGLSLVARIVELSMENVALVGEVRDQLSGTLRMMIDLVEQRLPDYAAHSERVSRYAVAIGRFRGMGGEEIEDLRVSGLLHDVGMLAVPETILNTPRRLTLEEQVDLRGHPEHGADLTRAANFPARVQEAIRSHHERVDGLGYPQGLSGEDIPIASRILTVCDAFVAMISDRPHRAAISVSDALEALRQSGGTHYDERVVEDFIHVQTQIDVDEPAADVVAPVTAGVLAV